MTSTAHALPVEPKYGRWVVALVGVFGCLIILGAVNVDPWISMRIEPVRSCLLLLLRLSPEALMFTPQRLVSWLAGRRLNCRLPEKRPGGMWQGLSAYSRGGG